MYSGLSIVHLLFRKLQYVDGEAFSSLPKQYIKEIVALLYLVIFTLVKLIAFCLIEFVAITVLFCRATFHHLFHYNLA